MSLLRTYTLAIAIAATLLTSAFALPATTTDFPLGPRTIYTLTPVLPATPRTTYTVTPISTTLTLSPLAATPTLAGPNDAAIEPRRIRSKHLKINCRLICDPWAELYSREMCQERSACAGGPDDEKESLNRHQVRDLFEVYFPQMLAYKDFAKRYNMDDGKIRHKELNEFIAEYQSGAYFDLIAR